MAQQDSGWHNDSEVDQGDTGLNYSPYDSENEAFPRPAFRVDRANHDKNLSSAGAIQFMPMKGSIQSPRAKSQKILPIYQKDALAHTFATASIDVDEIPEQMQMNSQYESSYEGSRLEAEFHVLPDASSDAEIDLVTEFVEQKEASHQNRVKLQATAGQRKMRIRKNYTEHKIKQRVKRKQGPVNKVKYIGKATTRESITGNDIGIELINEPKK
jgi:hypothetical protein